EPESDMPLREADMTVTDLPTALLEPFAGARTALLGPVLAKVTLEAEPQSGGAVELEARVESDRLTGDIDLQRGADGTIEIDEGSTIALTLTPETFARWQAQRAAEAAAGGDATGATEASPPMQLLEPAKAELTIHTARLAMRERNG